MKKCFKCGEIKGINCFYTHRGMADGYLNKCISCAKADVLNYREKNIESVRSHDRERKRTLESKKETAKRTISYRNRFPEKQKAHSAIARALKNKKIVKKPCAVCGLTERLEAHHFDYSKRLEVIWLCSEHHSAVHFPKIPF